jgi:SAM-dependent methyltransferase
MDREEIQNELYSTPYHHLPFEAEGVWWVSQSLDWGYKYLAILTSVAELVCASDFSISHPRRVLDFGCGDGRLIKELLRRCPDIVALIGTDTSDRALAFARAWTWGDERVHLFKRLTDIDGRFLPVETVVAMEVLEHIPPSDLGKTIQSLSEVLAVNGHLVVSVPTTNVSVNPKHHQHFTWETLSQVTSKFFTPVTFKYVHRQGWFAEILRRAVVNRWWIANSPAWLKVTSTLYRRFVGHATKRTGTHIVAVFRVLS